MKKINIVSYGIVKAISLTLIILIIIIVLVGGQKADYMSVMSFSSKAKGINDENIVNVIKNGKDTTYLHQIKIVNGEVQMHLHFKSMMQLITNLERVMDEYTYFYFEELDNVNKLTILISEQAVENKIFSVYISKNDYKAGKEIYIEPLT